MSIKYGQQSALGFTFPLPGVGGGGGSPMHKLYGHIPLGILWLLTSLVWYRGTEGNQGVLV